MPDFAYIARDLTGNRVEGILAAGTEREAVATLSAITHATHPKVEAILKAMTHVLRDTPTALVNPIVELIAQGMGQNPAAEQWRKLVAVDLSFYKSYISEEIRDEGRAEGRVEGRAEDILDAFEVRGIDVSEAVRDRLTTCGDPEHQNALPPVQRPGPGRGAHLRKEAPDG